MSKTIIIEYIWCFECGTMFFAEKTENQEYKCPQCNAKLKDFENFCYIVNK